ncbi:MAG: hypothetical protein WBC80_18210, partial [Isosphaeraceae bacterium]
MLAPAGLPELADVVVARTLPQIWPQPIHFVPGLRACRRRPRRLDAGRRHARGRVQD